jgi:uncharacterized protein YcbX
MDNFILSEINIYPVKSLGGISLNECRMEKRGLQYDRRWVLVGCDDNIFISQREINTLCLFRPAFDNNGFKITNINHSSSINIPFGIETGEKANVTIWEDTCEAIHYSSQIDKWFSDITGYNCKLMYMPDASRREADKKFAVADDIVSFADAFPILIIGQSALEKYNNISGNNFKMNRFRPNLVFTGGEAHIEDTWKKFNINSTDFYPVKQCSRCNVTTIEQETGSIGKEPLKTLATYRNFDNKIKFGTYCVPGGLSAASILKLGSELKIQEAA